MTLLTNLATGLEMLFLPRFANRPRRCRIKFPRTIRNPDQITVGDHVFIGPGSILSAQTKFVSREGTQQFNGAIRIGSRVQATASLQLYAFEQIEIEDDVLLAANVHMADAFHGYRSATIPYKDQPFHDPAPIRVGRGSWIGQNVVILPGVTIGEFCIVGANSVVTESIPPQRIAVGAPARVIKHWSSTANRWLPGEAGA